MDSIYENLLPNALMIGVDYDLFWTLNPKSLSPFVKAFNLRQKYDDTIAWRIGSYVKVAIASSFGKDVKYPTKPLTSENREMTPQEIKERMIERMNIINQKFGKEE